MKWNLVLGAFTLATTLVAQQNVIVYKQPGRFAGWPANHGIWSWGNEIAVGFEAGKFRQNDGKNHAIDYDQPADHLIARSVDGGGTWTIERPKGLEPPEGAKVAGVPTRGGRPAADFTGSIRFDDPNFAMTFRMESHHTGPSRFYYSYNRGKSWDGPYRMPDFGTKGIAARTDYLVNGPSDCTVFLTAAKPNGREGRVLCVRTRDGGKTWNKLGWVTPEPEGDDYAIMPATVRLSPRTLFTAVRYRQFIDTFQSDDDGVNWTRVGRAAPGIGNPPSLLKLRDGRLALAYGRRQQPFGIRARLSSDNGQSWSEEIILRNDGGGWDLGYVRSVQRPDGKIVSVYYFNDAPDQERYIAGTIWDPAKK